MTNSGRADRAKAPMPENELMSTSTVVFICDTCRGFVGAEGIVAELTALCCHLHFHEFGPVAIVKLAFFLHIAFFS